MWVRPVVHSSAKISDSVARQSHAGWLSRAQQAVRASIRSTNHGSPPRQCLALRFRPCASWRKGTAQTWATRPHELWPGLDPWRQSLEQYRCIPPEGCVRHDQDLRLGPRASKASKLLQWMVKRREAYCHFAILAHSRQHKAEGTVEAHGISMCTQPWCAHLHGVLDRGCAGVIHHHGRHPVPQPPSKLLQLATQ